MFRSLDLTQNVAPLPSKHFHHGLLYRGGSGAFAAEQEVSVDDFLQTIQEIEMVEKTAQYYTEVQRKELEERRKTLSEQGLRRAEEEWKELIDEVRAEMQKGTDPTSKAVQLLA